MSSEKQKTGDFKKGDRVWVALLDKDNITRGVAKPVDCTVLEVYTDCLLLYVSDCCGSLQILKKCVFKDCLSCALMLLKEREAEVKKVCETLNYQLEAIRETLFKEQERCVRSREE